MSFSIFGIQFRLRAKRTRSQAKAFERATQLLQARLPWQHLADEYRAVGRQADAERAWARAQALSEPKTNAGQKKAARLQ